MIKNNNTKERDYVEKESTLTTHPDTWVLFLLSIAIGCLAVAFILTADM